jgi:hypothetical protein
MAVPPSPTPQLRKLGLLNGARWRLDSAPRDWTFEIDPDSSDRVAEGSPADVVITFVTAAEQIVPALVRLEPAIFPAGALWVAWPRKAAGHPSDITDTVIRDAALARSLVDTKVAAIDTDWSGLKLVWRVTARS